jgi:hypothetical protein
MRTLESLLLVLAIGIVPHSAAAQQPATTLDQVIGRVISQEAAQMQSIKK